MPNVKRSYIAVLPDGTESNHELWEHEDFRRNHPAREAAEEAVREAKLTTPRNEPRSVPVQVFALSIVEGKLKRCLSGTFDVMPPPARMTDEEFDEEMSGLLSDLPDEFKNYVSRKAYDEGHYAGHEEVLSYARGILEELKPAIDAYTKRLKGAK